MTPYPLGEAISLKVEIDMSLLIDQAVLERCLWFLLQQIFSDCFEHAGVAYVLFFIILSNQNFDFLVLENLSDWPHVLQSSVITTIGFVKGAPDIDVQGFNVYHKNRLILVRALLCILHGAWCINSLFFPVAVCCQLGCNRLKQKHLCVCQIFV